MEATALAPAIDEAKFASLPPESAEVPELAPEAPWSPRKKFGFRFLFLYVLMLIDPWFTSTVMPGAAFKKNFATPFSEIGLAPDAIKRLFYPSVCGPDRIWHLCWIPENVWLLLVCVLGAVLWTILDKRRRDYRTLNEIFRTILRCYVIADMLHFAWAKFTVKQFGIGPEGIDLLTPLGDWVGGTVMWRTMGESMVYGMFTGLGELTAAVFLLRRKTTTLGAMVLLSVTSTIFTYDIVASHHYSKLAWQFMMISVILMAPDATRLRNFYIANRPAPPMTPTATIIDRKWGWVPELVLVGLFVVFRFIPWDAVHYWTQRPNHPFVGLYEVQRFTRNGRDIPPNLTDSTRWAFLSINSEGGGGRYRRHLAPTFLNLVYMDGASQQLNVTIDAKKKRMMVRGGSQIDTMPRLLVARFDYQREGDSIFRIQSVVPSRTRPRPAPPWTTRDTISVVLRRIHDDVWPMRGGTGYVPLSMQSGQGTRP